MKKMKKQMKKPDKCVLCSKQINNGRGVPSKTGFCSSCSSLVRNNNFTRLRKRIIENSISSLTKADSLNHTIK